MLATKPMHNQVEEGWIHALHAEASTHRAVRHPYLRALAEGTLPDPRGAVVDFAVQYSAYSYWFQRYLSGLIHQLDDASHRRCLIHNLTEESGHVAEEDLPAIVAAGIDPEWIDGVPHPALFKRFVDALGVEPAQSSWRQEVLTWRQLFLYLCSHGGAAVGVGALGFGTESVVAQIYKPITAAIERFVDVTARERVFFDLHATVDDAHGESLEQVARHFGATTAGQDALRFGALSALHLREAFYDAMLRRAEEMNDD